MIKAKGTPKPHLYFRNGRWCIFNPLYNAKFQYNVTVEFRWLNAYEWCQYKNTGGF